MPYDLIASTIRELTALGAASSPFAYASRLFLELVPMSDVPRGAQILGRELQWDPYVDTAQQRANVGRELCAWLLRVRDMEPSERAVIALYNVMFPYDVALEPAPSPRLRLVTPLPPARQPGVSSLRAQLDPPPARVLRRR